jgi:hypothetical protein
MISTLRKMVYAVATGIKFANIAAVFVALMAVAVAPRGIQQ